MKKMAIFIAVGWVIFVIPSVPTDCMAGEKLQPITLKFADSIVENSWFGQQHKWWASEVGKRTGGKVKVQIFWMESLVKWKDMLSGIQSGMADLGWIGATYHPSNLPLNLTFTNPFNIREDYVTSILAALDTVENEPNLKAEFERENVILLGSHISGMVQLASKKCISSMAGLKGKTLRTWGGGRAKYYEYLGANPIFMAYTDIYEAIDRGTISAFDMSWLLSNTFKHYEVVKCILMTNSGGAIGGDGIFMNLKVFRNFPQEVQKMLLDLRKEYAERYAKNLMDIESNYLREWETKYGVTMKYLTPEDQKINFEAGKRAQEYFLKKQESEGHTAAPKVWNYYMNALKKYEDQRARKK